MSIQMKKIVIAGALASALATGVVSTAAAASKEKCYGISKAGQNDCASSVAGSTCAGTQKVDYDPNGWKYVAEGTCESMEVDGHKGSLKPKA